MTLKYGDKVYRQWARREYVRNPITGNDGYKTAEVWSTHGEAFRFRMEPVPGVHKYKKSSRGYYRHPRTTQELRLVEPHSEFVHIRRKRSKRYLPTWYDDLTIADNRQHGWKRSKKKRQWM